MTYYDFLECTYVKKHFYNLAILTDKDIDITMKEIVFGNFELRTWNGYPEFSASFDSVRPFCPDDEDLRDRIEELTYDMEPQLLLEWCNDYRCCPDELVDTVYSDSGTDELVEMLYDTSIYPNTVYDKNGNEWNFESSCGGQYDPRPDIDKIYDDDLFNDLMYMWDHYHLKELNDNNPDYKIYERVVEHADKWSECRLVEQTIADFINKEMI